MSTQGKYTREERKIAGEIHDLQRKITYLKKRIHKLKKELGGKYGVKKSELKTKSPTGQRMYNRKINGW